MLNEFRSTSITWDKATSRIYSPLTANASDENGRKLVVQIVNSGQVEDLTGASLHLYWITRDKLHDGLDVFKAVDLEKGEFELSYTTGMLSNQGVLNANLVLIDTVGRVVSERFKITVTEGIDNDAIQSENSFSSLTQALIDISNLEQNYAPRLNDLTAQLQQTEQNLNAQLAQKINKGDVSVADINKNLGKIDQTYLSEELLRQIAGTTSINATHAPLSVTSIKLADKAISANKTDFFKVSTNLINEKTLTKDKSIDASTGEVIDNAGANSLTDFIPIKPNTSYTSYRALRKAFYTDDRTFILSDTTDGTWTTPTNAYYVRIVAPTSYFGSTLQLNVGSTLLPFEKYYEYIPYNFIEKKLIETNDISLNSIEPRNTSFFYDSTNLFSKENVEEGKVIPVNTGVPVVNGEYVVSDFTPISANVSYTAKGVLRATYYDKNKVYLNFYSFDATNDETTTTPANTAYVRFSVGNYYRQTAQVNIGDVLLPYEIGGSFVRKGYLPPKSIDAEKLANITLTEKFSNTDISIDYKNKSIKKINENYPVVDMDISGVFSKIEPIVSVPSTVSSSKSADIYALYDALMSQYPTYISKTLLGREASPSALPIYRYDFKPVRPEGATNLRVAKYIITTGTHPEKSSVWALYHMLKNICDNWQNNELLEALRFNFHFIIIPIMNPWAYDSGNRTNYNGVDMARNFPANWVQGTAGSPTYGGTAPLSEIEAQLINQLMLNNLDALGVIDFHTFQTPVDGYGFIWAATANRQTSNISMALVQRMNRKWKKDYTFINQNPDVFIGSVNGIAGSAPSGSLGMQANEYGFRGALTFEICDRVHADTNGVAFDSNVLTMGYEAFTNFLLIMSDELLKH